ncbi:MFS transporter, partial [Oleiphilus sp. HI0080]
MLHAHSDWRQSLQSFKHPRVLSMLFFGFSAGVPLLLIFSSLSLWLREAGVERSTVTYFSWAALAYSFKFLWAPLIDRLPLPLLTRVLGRRRAWLLVSQVAVMLAIALIAMINPVEENALNVMALAVVLLGFSSATQDIVIDAYRIESVGVDLQALMSSTYIAGYRIGMLVSGAGALVLASHFGSAPDAYSYEAWRLTYFAMSLVMLVGLLTTLLVSEPTSSVSLHQYSSGQYLRFLCLFVLSVALFVLLYAVGSEAAQDFKTELTFRLDNAPLANFLIEAARLLGGLVTVALFIRLVSFTPLYEKQLIHDSYV